MKLPATLLLTYQAEYEKNKDITIEDICEKYKVSKTQLKGYTKWKKRNIQTTKPKDIVVNEDKKQDVVKASTILKDIEEFKELAIANAVRFMKEDIKYAEIKEFKDIVSIVDSIEKSYKDAKDQQGVTVNIAIQNLVEKFSDDC